MSGTQEETTTIETSEVHLWVESILVPAPVENTLVRGRPALPPELRRGKVETYLTTAVINTIDRLAAEDGRTRAGWIERAVMAALKAAGEAK